MSNQRTPNENRNRRRNKTNQSRGVFLDDNEVKKENKLLNLFNKDDEIDDISRQSTRRRNHDSLSITRELSRNDYKSIHVFEEDVKGDTEKRKRRSRNKGKTVILFGASIFVFVAAVIGSYFLFFNNTKDTEEEKSSAVMAATTNENRVVIYTNNTPLEIFTDAETVGEVFEENEIVVSDEQKSSHNEDSTIEDNMEIFISNPMTVSIIQNDITNSVTMYGGKVADVFAEMEIELDEHDIVEPSSDTLITDQMIITFTDVEIKEISVVEDIPYETEEGETKTVESGYYHVEEEGGKGTVRITYQVKYINNEEESREEISREVIEKPTNRVILWGTAIPSNNNESSDDGGSGDSGSYDDITVNNPGEQATNPSVPAAPSDYVEIMSGHVTAYTHTGSTTATGTWPRSTRTLNNPGSCAVVPNTIPYGSLLYVTGYGYCIAEDTGAFRHDEDRWNQIDLFMNTRDECITWGRRKDVRVYILRKGY